MNSDDKLIADLAQQLGFDEPGASREDRASELKERYKGKSDQELITEILKVKNSLKKDKVQFEKQMKAINALGAMMTGEQKARLEKLIRLLEAE